MKFNKLNITGLGLALLAIGMTSCGDDFKATYEPTEPLENQPSVYFALGESSQTVEAGEDDTKFELNVYRANTTGAATYNVSCESNAGNLFTVPSSVSFADGEGSATLTVNFVATELQQNFDYLFSFKLDGNDTPYYTTSASVKLSYIPWKSLGMATYWETFVATWFGVDDPTIYQVEIQEHPTMKGLYRLVNPYGAAYPYNDPGDWDDSKNYFFYFNCTNPEKVFVSDKNGKAIQIFFTGMSWSYGEFAFGSLASLRIAQGKPEAAEGLYGQLKNGNITFPVKNSLLAGMTGYNDLALYYANNENFRIILPGYELDVEEPAWEQLGTGLFTDGFVDAVYGEEPATYEVEVEENAEVPGLYRIVNVYQNQANPINEPSDEDIYIEIDATNPNFVTIEPQATGLVDPEDGPLYIMNRATLYVKQGNSESAIIGAGYNDTLEDGVINFAAGHGLIYFPDTEAENNVYASPAAGQLVLPEAYNAGARSKAKAKSIFAPKKLGKKNVDSLMKGMRFDEDFLSANGIKLEK
ncbi:MAG: hypothetical protein K2M04_08945 [Muribaculaceae bacterium]|nr:hypothetical protein [Muribaculaceae bacterium]